MWRSRGETGPRAEQRKLNLNKYSMTLSNREQTTFNIVDRIWKTKASNILKTDKNLQNNILKNDNLLDSLSYKVNKDGSITKYDKKYVINRLNKTEFGKNPKQTFFETDHIADITSANAAGINALRNLQTIPKILNNDFKKPAQAFLERLSKQKKISIEDFGKVQEIIKIAKELGVTIYVKNPAKLRLGNKKFVGAEYYHLASKPGEMPYTLQSQNIIKKYMGEGYTLDAIANKNVNIFNQGGRVGYKKGGQVKLNTADYIEEYGDGTELIHYKSSLRAITKQLD